MTIAEEDFCFIIYLDETGAPVGRMVSITRLGDIHPNVLSLKITVLICRMMASMNSAINRKKININNLKGDFEFDSPLDIYAFRVTADHSNDHETPMLEACRFLGDDDGLGHAWEIVESLADDETRLMFYHRICTLCEVTKNTRLAMRHDKDFSPIQALINLL